MSTSKADTRTPTESAIVHSTFQAGGTSSVEDSQTPQQQESGPTSQHGEIKRGGGFNVAVAKTCLIPIVH